MGTNNISDILAATGAGTRALGAYNASSAQRQSLDYQASVQSDNAIIAQDKASIAVDNGQTSAENQELKTAQTLGTQRAAISANGIQMDSGSAANLQQSTQMMGQRDTDQIQTNALREAWGYSTQSADDTSNATALRSMSSSVNPLAAAATSMLGSATQVSPVLLSLSNAKNGNKNLGD